jgi:hypothetical protein
MLEVVSGSEDHAHDTMTSDQSMGDTQEIAGPTDHEEDLTIKIVAGVGKGSNGPMSILEASVEPETAPPLPSEGDTASTHSLPVAQVTETHLPQTRPSTARLNSSGSTGLHPPSARTHRYSSVENTVAAGERTNRHRSTIEVCTDFFHQKKLIMSYGLHLLVPWVQPTFRFLLQSHPSARRATYCSFSKWYA